MKYKLPGFENYKKYQQGGMTGNSYSTSVYTPYKRQREQIVPFQMAFPQSQKKEGTADKAKKQLEQEGLISDVDAFYDKARALDQYYNQLSELDILSNSESFLKWKAATNKLYSGDNINRLKKNAELYEESIKDINANKKGEAFLTDANGMLTVENIKETEKKGKAVLQQMSINDFLQKAKEEPNTYRAYKVASALENRFNDKRYENQNVLLNNIRGTSSLKLIEGKIKGSLDTIKGSNEWSTITTGLDAVASKTGSLSSINKIGSSGSNNKKFVEAAKSHLLNTLTPSDWTQLEMQALNILPSDQATPENIKAKAFQIASELFQVSTKSSKQIGSDDSIAKERMGFGAGTDFKRRKTDEFLNNSIGLGDKVDPNFVAGNIGFSSFATGSRIFKGKDKVTQTEDGAITNIDLAMNAPAINFMGNNQQNMFSINGKSVPKGQVLVDGESKVANGYAYQDKNTGEWVTPMSNPELLTDFKGFNTDMQNLTRQVYDSYGDNLAGADLKINQLTQDIMKKYPKLQNRNLKPVKVVYFDGVISDGPEENEEVIDSLDSSYKKDVDSKQEEKFTAILKQNNKLTSSHTGFSNLWMNPSYVKTTFFIPASSVASVASKTEDIYNPELNPTSLGYIDTKKTQKAVTINDF